MHLWGNERARHRKEIRSIITSKCWFPLKLVHIFLLNYNYFRWGKFNWFVHLLILIQEKLTFMYIFATIQSRQFKWMPSGVTMNEIENEIRFQHKRSNETHIFVLCSNVAKEIVHTAGKWASMQSTSNDIVEWHHKTGNCHCKSMTKY